MGGVEVRQSRKRGELKKGGGSRLSRGDKGGSEWGRRGGTWAKGGQHRFWSRPRIMMKTAAKVGREKREKKKSNEKITN